MGVENRDYYRAPTRGSSPLLGFTATAVGALIVAHVAVFIGEIASGGRLIPVLAASPRDLLDLRLYKVLTAMFAERDDTVLTIAWNLIFLFFFGRELEQIYGRRHFLIFYVMAGALSTVVEAVVLGLAGRSTQLILGSGGATLGIVTLFTLFYPDRRILFFFVPVPVWLLCVAFVVKDIFDAVGRGDPGNVAHLAGAAMAFATWYLNLRWRRLGVRGLRSFFRAHRRRRAAKIIPMPRTHREDEARRISSRIDQLLAKITQEGKDSLTEEEWAFLRDNSGRYRSGPPS